MRTIMAFVFLLGFLSVAAQESIEVKIESRPSSLGVQAAFEVMVPQATADEAIHLWKKTVIPGKLFKKGPKMEKVKDEWIANHIVISDITTFPLNVITQVNTFTGNIYIRIFLQTEGGFLGSSGSSPETNERAEKFIRNYAVDLYREAVSKELKAEEKQLKNLENDLHRLKRKNRNYNNKISVARKDERNLQIESDQNEELLKNQENVIRMDNTGPEDKTARGQLEKQMKSTRKDLNKARKSQTKFSRKVNKNKRAQNDKQTEIKRQKDRVEQVKIKLDNIR